MKACLYFDQFEEMFATVAEMRAIINCCSGSMGGMSAVPEWCYTEAKHSALVTIHQRRFGCQKLAIP